MALLHDPNQNHLLAALPADELERLVPHLEPVAMPLGDILYRPGSWLQHVYFPATSIVSLHYGLENGASAEIAGVGNEGMLGIPLFMGTSTAPSRVIVRAEGYGFRLKAHLLAEEFRRGGTMQRLLKRYTQALITQASQTAVCSRHHSVKQQLSRWLLTTLDRTSTNELILTQKLAADMLGVSRESVMEAAGKLQKGGFIRKLRGSITILDRAGLEDHACECYSVIKMEYDRLLGQDSDWVRLAGNAMVLPDVNAAIHAPS